MVYELYLNKTVTKQNKAKQKTWCSKPTTLVGLPHPKLPIYYLGQKNLKILSIFQSYLHNFVNEYIYLKLEATINQSN